MTEEEAIELLEMAKQSLKEQMPVLTRINPQTSKSLEKNALIIIEAYSTAIEALEKVEEYKRLEEQGLLLRLHCKVGDEVYIVGDRFPAMIESIVISEDNHIMFEFVEYDKSPELTEVWDSGGFELEDIGRTVFFTLEEAEQKLKEMGE